MNDTVQVVVWVAVLMVVAGLAWLALRLRRDLRGLRRPVDGEEGTGLSLLQQQIEALRVTVHRSLADGQTRLDQRFDALTTSVGDRLEATRRTLDERLGAADQVVREVKRSLGEVDASVKGVAEVTHSIRELQDILKAPKRRGGLGEFFLAELLGQILPSSSYELQHSFAGGERVDAVIRAGGQLVPVDAKFPLENFRRLMRATGEESRRRERRAFLADVKKHVDDIATKYIRPDEGTFDFALMYIPAENVYYETVLNDEDSPSGFLPYALERRVIPVSPNSFYAYLQVILIGLQGLRIEAHARTILERLQALRAEFTRFAEDFAVVGRHLGHASSKYDESLKKIDRFGGRLEALTAADEPETVSAVPDDGNGQRLPAPDRPAPASSPVTAVDLEPTHRTGERR